MLFQSQIVDFWVLNMLQSVAVLPKPDIIFHCAIDLLLKNRKKLRHNIALNQYPLIIMNMGTVFYFEAMSYVFVGLQKLSKPKICS